MEHLGSNYLLKSDPRPRLGRDDWEHLHLVGRSPKLGVRGRSFLDQIRNQLAQFPQTQFPSQLREEYRVRTGDHQCWQPLKGYRVVLRVYDPGRT